MTVKVPVVRQKDAMQCGVACLTMICRHYGSHLSLDDADEICSATREGVSMLAIRESAASLGLDAEAAKISTDQLTMLPLPAILHWNQNHFVVLCGVEKGGRKFIVADPAKGRVKYTREEFESHWAAGKGGEDMGKGIAMILQPNESFEKAAGKGHDKERRSLRFMLGYVQKYRRQFILIFLSLAIGCLFQIVMPFLTQQIVDKGIHNKDIDFVWLILLGELAIVIGRTATDFYRRWLLLHISMHINISLVSDFFIKLLKLPMSFFDTKLSGDLLQRMSDHGRVQSFLTGQVLGIAFSILSFVVFGAILFTYDKLIFIIFLLGSIAYGLWIAAFLKRRKLLDYDMFDCQSKNQNRTWQFITSMQEIKLQDCEQRRRKEWEDTQMDLFAVQMRSLRLQQTQEAGAIFINEVKNILITVFSASAVIYGDITFGTMLAVQYIVGQLNSPVEQLMSFIYSLQDVRISLERINDIHMKKNEESEQRNVSSFPNDDKSIDIKNLDFKYDPHAVRWTLKDISFRIPAGKVTAIVGASGSGKTTMIKLMLGYYTPLAGIIDVAGENLERYDLKWWRRHCGVVMQDGVIFSESIARNIAVSDGEVDMERLKDAARIACIDDYVESLPLRYDTKIGPDGTGLSQGQRQRILIARAVYRNPDFIFLDEATNSLDARNERAIVENLAKFYRGRTVVVVAHRLSTVRDADQIIVLDKGRVAETGDHSSLIQLRGAYHALVKNQLELGG